MSKLDNAIEILAAISTTYDIRQLVQSSQNLSAGPDENDYAEIDLLLKESII